MKKILTILLMMTITGIVSIFQVNVNAEMFQDYDGKLITEQQYEYRIFQCSQMQVYEELDKNIDCYSWVLTEEGSKAIIEKVISDVNKEFFG